MTTVTPRSCVHQDAKDFFVRIGRKYFGRKGIGVAVSNIPADLASCKMQPNQTKSTPLGMVYTLRCKVPTKFS